MTKKKLTKTSSNLYDDIVKPPKKGGGVIGFNSNLKYATTLRIHMKRTSYRS